MILCISLSVSPIWGCSLPYDLISLMDLKRVNILFCSAFYLLLEWSGYFQDFYIADQKFGVCLRFYRNIFLLIKRERFIRKVVLDTCSSTSFFLFFNVFRMWWLELLHPSYNQNRRLCWHTREGRLEILKIFGSKIIILNAVLYLGISTSRILVMLCEIKINQLIFGQLLCGFASKTSLIDF